MTIRCRRRLGIVPIGGNAIGAVVVLTAMAKAVLDGTVIAESDETVVVEGNHYFPPSSVSWDHFSETKRTSVCGWKGTASYFSVSVGDQSLDNVAWTYREPMEAAAEIKDFVAFYPQVSVEA